MEEKIMSLEESKPIETKKRRHYNYGIGNWVKKQLSRIPALIENFFRLKTLVLLGILLLLNKQGAFENYPAIQEAIALIASIINWFWKCLINFIEFI